MTLTKSSYQQQTLEFVTDSSTESFQCTCPKCNSENAVMILWEQIEGAINTYSRVKCSACGYCEQDDDNDLSENDYDAELDVLKTFNDLCIKIVNRTRIATLFTELKLFIINNPLIECYFDTKDEFALIIDQLRIKNSQ
ncbi:hypothetical protein [Photobacterium damselae]|uniref:hypothetical protein n=1 Tax=Photobacterium damselae TaxID=38293 RepID=UPI0040698239